MSFEVINPSTLKELLASVGKLQRNKFRFGAGYTDLLLELRKNPEESITVVNLARVNDSRFTGIRTTSAGLRLGAGVTAQKITMSEVINEKYPVLYESALQLASSQIRQVATLGGNICTASPSGDMTCALVALQATCYIVNTLGKIRKVPINDFFKGVRKTALKRNELLWYIAVPSPVKNAKRIISGFIKIGTRRSMECSVISLGYHIQANAVGEIIKAGMAIGASAPTIRFTESAGNYLAGKNILRITDTIKLEFAKKVLAYASPISDIRATAAYRKEALFNISKSILEGYE